MCVFVVRDTGCDIVQKRPQPLIPSQIRIKTPLISNLYINIRSSVTYNPCLRAVEEF